MYIEFRLPSGAGGAAAGTALAQINIDIDRWVKKYDIKSYRTKIHKYTYRLSLSNDKVYTHFALTWDPVYNASRNFVFKNPDNN
jgi:hypothetical protein